MKFWFPFLKGLHFDSMSMSVLLVAFLSACGGGGGGGGEQPPPVNPVQVTLLESLSTDATDLDVSIASDGTGHAVWKQIVGSHTAIFGSRYSNAKWEKPQQISPIDGAFPHDALDPHVVPLPNGEALVIWEQASAFLIETNISNNVRFSFTIGGIWQPAQNVQIGGQDEIASLELVTDGKGLAVATWIRNDVLFARTFNGTAFVTNVEIIGSGDRASQPSVAMDASGNALAAWLELDKADSPQEEDQTFVMVKAFQNGGWQFTGISAVDFNVDTDSVSSPAVAIAAGKGVVTWVQRLPGQSNEVFGRTYETRLNLPPNRSDAVKLGAVGVTAQPVAAIDNQARATIMWVDRRDNNKDKVFASILQGSTLLRNAMNVGGDDFRDILNPEVVVDGTGRLTAVWQGRRSEPSDRLFLTRLASVDGDWTPPTVVDGESGAALFPKLVGNDAGTSIAVWERTNSGSRDAVAGVID